MKLRTVIQTLCCGAGLLAPQQGRARPLPEVKLALILARTGLGADENLPAQKTAQMVVAQINASGGLLGRKVQLLQLDNASTPLGSKNAVECAVSQGVIGVIGPFRSSHCLAAVPVISSARIPMITPSATHSEVTLGSRFVFRACFTDEFQGRAMARFARQYLGASRAVVFTNLTENYSIDLGRSFSAGFTALGGQILEAAGYQGNAVDFSALLAPLKHLHPDVVFVPGYPRDSGLLISQAANSGLRTVFLGADAWDLGQGVDHFAGAVLEGAYHSTLGSCDPADARNRALLAEFRRRYGNNGLGSMQIPLTHDAILLFADAVRRAHSFDPERITQALQRTQGFEGVTGSFAFDANRNPVGRDMAVLRFQNHAWRYCKSIGSGR